MLFILHGQLEKIPYILCGIRKLIKLIISMDKKWNITIHFHIFIFSFLLHGFVYSSDIAVRSIEEMALEYEDDKNSMIAMTERDNSNLYEDFYEELDNRIRIEPSMNVIFFGPPSSFMRLDTETILHLLINTKKHLIPISRTLLAWDMITDGKTAAFLQGREFLAFDTLLNKVPEEDLYYVNFGDPSVIRFFSTHNLKLHKRKLGVLIAAYRRYYGMHWYTNSTYINELGYMLCGFSSFDLMKITPETFKELNIDVLGKLVGCDANQTKTLYNIATKPQAYGDPYKWSSHEITRLGSLFGCIPKEDISSIQLEAIAAITSQVMKSINQVKLEYFTKEQILRMSPATRRMFILRMQLKNSLDMSQLAKRAKAVQKSPDSLVVLVTLVLVFFNSF